MASNISTILDALNTQVQAVIGADWKEMKYIYEPEKNDKRGADKGYGVGVGESDTVEGVTTKITKDTTFFIQLAKRFANRNDDSNERTAINDIYEQLEAIDQQVFERKLGIQTVVFVVQSIGTEAPVNISDDVVMVKANYVIKHRK